MLNLRNLVERFFRYMQVNNIEIYNEFSFQHELGIYLRHKLPDWKIQFERNVSYFNHEGPETIKKEIDIVIFNEDKSEKYAIELKYPNNGQVPEQMYKFVQDIKFMEQLRDESYNFTSTATVVLTPDNLFVPIDVFDPDKKTRVRNRKKTGIYKHFRTDYGLKGNIKKPTGEKKGIDSINLGGEYIINWYTLFNGEFYYIVEI